VQQLRENFVQLMSARPAQAAAALRAITGPIRVRSDRAPWLRQSHLVARIQIDFASACSEVASASEPGAAVPPISGFGTIVEVSLRKRPFYERHGDAVVRMRDKEGKSFVQIARELPGNATPRSVQIAYDFGKHGTPDPDDRGWRNHCKRRDERKAARQVTPPPGADAGPQLAVDVEPAGAAGPEISGVPDAFDGAHDDQTASVIMPAA